MTATDNRIQATAVLRADATTAIVPPGGPSDDNRCVVAQAEMSWNAAVVALVIAGGLAWLFYRPVSLPLMWAAAAQLLTGAILRGMWTLHPFTALALYFCGNLTQEDSPRLAREALANHRRAVSNVFLWTGLIYGAVSAVVFAAEWWAVTAHADRIGVPAARSIFLGTNVHLFLLAFWAMFWVGRWRQLRLPRTEAGATRE